MLQTPLKNHSSFRFCREPQGSFRLVSRQLRSISPAQTGLAANGTEREEAGPDVSTSSGVSLPLTTKTSLCRLKNAGYGGQWYMMAQQTCVQLHKALERRAFNLGMILAHAYWLRENPSRQRWILTTYYLRNAHGKTPEFLLKSLLSGSRRPSPHAPDCPMGTAPWLSSFVPGPAENARVKWSKIERIKCMQVLRPQGGTHLATVAFEVRLAAVKPQQLY